MRQLSVSMPSAGKVEGPVPGLAASGPRVQPPYASRVELPYSPPCLDTSGGVWPCALTLPCLLTCFYCKWQTDHLSPSHSTSPLASLKRGSLVEFHQWAQNLVKEAGKRSGLQATSAIPKSLFPAQKHKRAVPFDGMGLRRKPGTSAFFNMLPATLWLLHYTSQQTCDLTTLVSNF